MNQVRVCCLHCQWVSEPCDTSQRVDAPDAVVVLRRPTVLHQTLVTHVISVHMPVTHEWLAERDWKALPA